MKEATYKFVVITLFYYSTLVISDDGHCIWYDHCESETCSGPKKLPFLYNGTAKELMGESSLKTFEEYCPHLLNRSGTTRTCCSDKQLIAMVTGLRFVKPFLKQCPSCWFNFRRYVCGITCAPDHSNYLYPKNTTSFKQDGKDAEAISEIRAYVTEKFANGLYNSCRNIQTSLGSVMNILCGSWGSKNCTADRWLKYMGDPKNNGVASLFINVELSDDQPISTNETDFHPFNAELYPCDQPIKEYDQQPCKCTDCPAACSSDLPKK